jgi:membrane protein YqaA with SNARE-associated domain
MYASMVQKERRKKTNTTCCFLSPILYMLCFFVSVPQHGDFFTLPAGFLSESAL